MAYIVLGVVILLAIVIISAGVKVVPQSETRVIERLGRFHSVLSPGLNFIIPLSTNRRQYIRAAWSRTVPADIMCVRWRQP